MDGAVWKNWEACAHSWAVVVASRSVFTWVCSIIFGMKIQMTLHWTSKVWQPRFLTRKIQISLSETSREFSYVFLKLIQRIIEDESAEKAVILSLLRWGCSARHKDGSDARLHLSTTQQLASWRIWKQILFRERKWVELNFSSFSTCASANGRPTLARILTLHAYYTTLFCQSPNQM